MISRILKRQLEKSNLSEELLPSNLDSWAEFLQKLSNAYVEFEKQAEFNQHTDPAP